MHNFIVHLEGADDSVVEAQVVQAHLGMSLRDVLSRIYDLNLDGRLRAEMLIVRLPVEEPWSEKEILSRSSPRSKQFFLEANDGSLGAFERARDRSVHILSSFDGMHFLSPNLSPYWVDDPLATYQIQPARALKSIRLAEFEEILFKSKAILTCPTGSTYRAPSGRVVRSFVRVGNIQYCRDVVDAIFFWLLPYLPNVGAILTDTWSISSIAFNLARLCRIYFGGKARVVEMIPHYPDEEDRGDLDTQSAIERLHSDWRSTQSDADVMLCLISATHSGRLANALRKVIEQDDFELTPRFVAIFALGETEIEALHDLRNDSRFKLLDESSDGTSRPVIIDKQVYFPLQFEDIPYEIDQKVASVFKPFFDRYAGNGLIKVHRTDKEAGRPRHHAIHLDTLVLLKTDRFIFSFEEKLSKLPSAPLLIVSPPHEAGRALAAQASTYFARNGKPCRVFAHANLYFSGDELSDEDRDLRGALHAAREQDALLVIDDVCITGTRLSQYQRYSRSERFKGRIDFLVGIARPRASHVWEYLRRYLSQRGPGLQKHTVDSVEFVLLPDWRDDECPWCRERMLYEKLFQSASLPDYLVKRLELLTKSTSTGLDEELFLCMSNLPAMKLGPTSLFVDERACQAEAFAAVAASLQSLRSSTSTNKPPLGPRHFPISTVLSHEDYLRSKWTDSILRASFLRAATIDELTYAKAATEEDRTRMLRSLIEQKTEGEHDIALEIVLANQLGKCQLEFDKDLFEKLRQFGEPEVFEYFYNRVAERPLDDYNGSEAPLLFDI